MKQERFEKDQLEEEEIQKQYQNHKRIPLQKFNEKYTQQIDHYQKIQQKREERKTELEFDE